MRILTGGGDDVATLWHLAVVPDGDSEAAASSVSVEAAADSPVNAQAGAGAGFTVAPTAVATLAGHTDSVAAVAFSCDGLLCATGGLDGLVRVRPQADPPVLNSRR